MASRSTRTIHATTAPRAGNAKLGDLGLATTIRDRDEQITRQLSGVIEDDPTTEDADDTATSMTRGVGTFLYRAPEVAQHRAYDSGADMYSLGVVAFELLRGCLLYTSPSPRDATLSRMPSSA